MPTLYQNFDIQIVPDAEGYTARVIRSPVGESVPIHFDLPFEEAELRGLFWLAGRVRRWRIASAEETERAALDPQQFGARLYQSLFAGEIGSHLLRSLDAAERLEQGLRIRLRLREVPELADLPWEYLYTPGLDRFPALSENTPIVRYIEMGHPQATLQVEPPLTILALIANPSDAEPLNVEQEWDRLQQALTRLQASQLVRLERLEQATLPALQDRLRAGEVHILHTIGHGYFDADTNEGGLVLENEAGTADRVAADRLAALLQDHESLRLIFLNACEGARGGRTDPFGGVAQKLVQQGIPTVLAMQFEVSDRAAIALAQEFYEAVAAGYPMDAAVAAARKSVYSAGNDLEWGTPVLFTRQDDNALLDPVWVSAAELAPYVGPTYPDSVHDLEQLRPQFPDHSRVESFVFTRHRLAVGENVTLMQPVYAQEDIQIGPRCRIQSHVIGRSSIYIQRGATLNGDLFAAQNIHIGESCTAQGSVTAQGNVHIARGCRVESIRGRDVEIGAGSAIGSVVAAGNLILEDSVEVSHCRVLGTLVLRNSGKEAGEIHIGAQSIIAGGLDWDPSIHLFLGSTQIGPANFFIRHGKALLPYTQKTPAAGQEILITTLLTQDLVATIHACTGTAFHL